MTTLISRVASIFSSVQPPLEDNGRKQSTDKPLQPLESHLHSAKAKRNRSHWTINLAEAGEECTNCLPPCPIDNLAFFKWQLVLAQQAMDLLNWVYKEAKEDDDPEVKEFQEIQDQCMKWLGHWKQLIKSWAVPEGVCLNLQKVWVHPLLKVCQTCSPGHQDMTPVSSAIHGGGVNEAAEASGRGSKWIENCNEPTSISDCG